MLCLQNVFGAVRLGGSVVRTADNFDRLPFSLSHRYV